MIDSLGTPLIISFYWNQEVFRHGYIYDFIADHETDAD